MYSAATYTGNGVNTDFAVPFPYINQSHVEVSVSSATRAYTWVNPGLVRVSPAPAIGAPVVVRRNSNRAARIVDFADSAALTEANLDLDSNQLMYLIQEATDQASTQSYFTTDAQGSRVINVADPINPTDGANRQWVLAYVSSITTSGLNLLPLDNVWTGTNRYTKNVQIGAAVFNPDSFANQDLIEVGKGLYVNHTSNLAGQISYGFAANVRRSSGYPMIVGAQINSWGEGTYAGSVWGVAIESIRKVTSTGANVALEASVANFNSNASDKDSVRCGLDVVFKNRGDGETKGGGTVEGVGTGGDWYNANSWAIQISSQNRSDSGVTRVGWNRGLRLRHFALDNAKAWIYDAAKPYDPGDYVTYSGNVYVAKEVLGAGVAPSGTTAHTASWAYLHGGTTRDAIAIDLSGIDTLTASRIRAGIKLRGLMPVMWDTEELVTTLFDPVSGKWSLRNSGTEAVGISVGGTTAGDISILGVPRVLGTQSFVSAHRNVAPLATTGAWAVVPLGTKEVDLRNEFSTGTSRFTATTPGVYDIVVQAQAEGASIGNRLYVGIAVNGTLYKAGSATLEGTAATAHCHAKVLLNGTTDYVEMRVMNTSGTGSITGEPTATFFQASKIA